MTTMHQLPAATSQPALLLDGELSPLASPSCTPLSMPERGESSRKSRRRGGSRMLSVLRSLTNSPSGNSIREPATWPAPSPTERSPGPRRRFGKLSMPFLRSPFGASVTVIHRFRSKSRQSYTSMEKIPNEQLPDISPEQIVSSASNGNSYSNSNTTSSGKSSGPTNGTGGTGGTGTTGKTSLESKVECNPGDKKTTKVIREREPEATATAEPNLSPIQETALDLSSPTILTVERAAAAKIYLENYYNEKLSKPSPHTLRRRYLEGELYHSSGLTEAEKDTRRRAFYKRETDHLRKMRVLDAKSIGAVQGKHNQLAGNYEVLKILGKGSFGVVRLVREKDRPGDFGHDMRLKKPVYAMKVIRKSAMLRTSQEAHLRAERDFLVAAEGSKWVVPLVTSFQDAANLYLVMDYMPGGDFLGLLIRENVLTEPVAKFYIAEMILCIEEAHSLRCIHRDIKPDNFLISASGHLKISDFGLAFDGHWSHDTNYYHTQRYSLLQKFNIPVEGDAIDRAEGLQGSVKWAQSVAQAMQKHERHASYPTPPPSPLAYEPLLNWRNRCGNRSAARSCWSVGVILYECLYGHTPFLSEEGGRQQTKRNIVNHKQTFAFPPRPVISRRCMDLIVNLICKKENRLSSRRYRYRDTNPEPLGRSRHHRGYQDWTGRSVYPHDGEDIKAHKWFRDIPWDRLQHIPPPFIPQLSGCEDTHYFDEEEPISDWSESQPEASSENEGLTPNPLIAYATVNGFPTTPPPRMVPYRSPEKVAVIQAQIAAFPRNVRGAIAKFVSLPYDSAKLKRMDREIEVMVPDVELCAEMKAFIRTYGRRERKRPRDRLLRDKITKGPVLEVRKQTAFMGYTYRRIGGRYYPPGTVDWGALRERSDGGRGKGKGSLSSSGTELAAYRAWCQGRAG
ncbi:kinase-like protein [Daldinia caldariorum]|uniref:kinase-like protein n=1 Tax=Daldinia caldariorum TaxID=326644 RepID=UPI002008D8EC|nr:kinase-like protein [Daldinia caldariorum]KAI1468889.1 kinase-like protein [Daldinia caldariorum]